MPLSYRGLTVDEWLANQPKPTPPVKVAAQAVSDFLDALIDGGFEGADSDFVRAIVVAATPTIVSNALYQGFNMFQQS